MRDSSSSTSPTVSPSATSFLKSQISVLKSPKQNDLQACPSQFSATRWGRLLGDISICGSMVTASPNPLTALAELDPCGRLWAMFDTALHSAPTPLLFHLVEANVGP